MIFILISLLPTAILEADLQNLFWDWPLASSDALQPSTIWLLTQVTGLQTKRFPISTALMESLQRRA